MGVSSGSTCSHSRCNNYTPIASVPCSKCTSLEETRQCNFCGETRTYTF